MKPMTLSQRWFRSNSIAWVTGFVLYTPIAHGVTGAHPDGLTPTQILAHTIAVSVVAVIVAGTQRRALAPFVSVPWIRVLVAPVAFNAGYWIGAYLPTELDTDILLGFLALGSAVWPGIIPINGHRLSAAVALLSFPVASFLAELALFVVLVGGWVSGLALARMLPPPSGDAAKRAFEAMMPMKKIDVAAIEAAVHG